MARLKDETKVITNPVRLSYANVWEPKSVNGGEAKYSVSLIISKGDTETIDCINKAIENAKELGKSKFGGKVPANLKMPLRDGDEDRPDDEAYQGSYFLNANSNTAPGIIDLSKRAITDESEVYSGCYARASISFYAFNSKGNRGIACGLQNIQKVKDGEALAGRASAASDFDDDYLGENDDDLDDMLG